MNQIDQIFDESRPELKGFNSFYYEQIYPFLFAKETHRLRQVKKAGIAAVATVLIGIGVTVFCYFQFPDWGVFGRLFPVLASGGIAFAQFNWMLNQIKGATKIHLMTNICKFLGWHYQEASMDSPQLDIWCENKLLPKHDRVSFEDHMSGNAHGADFKFCEAHMEKEERDSDGGTQWRTVFRGVLLDIDFHRKFLGRTVVLRDGGWFNRKKKAGMKRVGLVDPKFEKLFEAYGTDQVEARYLLTPTFMQRLVDLEESVSGKKIRFGFLGEKLHIAVETGDQFEAGSMLKPLTETHRTEKILDEVGAIFDVVDGVMKPLKKRF